MTEQPAKSDQHDTGFETLFGEDLKHAGEALSQVCDSNCDCYDCVCDCDRGCDVSG